LRRKKKRAIDFHVAIDSLAEKKAKTTPTVLGAGEKKRGKHRPLRRLSCCEEKEKRIDDHKMRKKKKEARPSARTVVPSRAVRKRMGGAFPSEGKIERKEAGGGRDLPARAPLYSGIDPRERRRLKKLIRRKSRENLEEEKKKRGQRPPP